jgi:hypothetical protein
MSRTLSMVLALCLMVVGVFGLLYLIMYSYGAWNWTFMVPITLLMTGAIWLYLDL